MPSAATPIAATAARRGLASAASPNPSGTTQSMMAAGAPPLPKLRASHQPSSQYREPAWFSVRDAIMTEPIALTGIRIYRDQVAGIRYQDELMLLDSCRAGIRDQA